MYLYFYMCIFMCKIVNLCVCLSGEVSKNEQVSEVNV